MPTFDFQCAKCKNVFEFSRAFGSKVNPACPKCKSKKTEKLFAPPSIVFKGEGWYKTDSRPKQKAAKPMESTGEKDKKGENVQKEEKGKNKKKVHESLGKNPA